jgi:hypothetical protein
MGLFKKLHEMDVNSSRHIKYESKRAEIKGKVEERKAQVAEDLSAKDTVQAARGRELGHISVEYKGGYDDQKRGRAKLYFYEQQIVYGFNGKPAKGLIMQASDVTSLEVTGQQQYAGSTNVSLWQSSLVTVGLKNGRIVSFKASNTPPGRVSDKLANAISYYHSLQAQAPSTDNAQEIMKYATLYKKGAITAEEYQAKKRQLLGL